MNDDLRVRMFTVASGVYMSAAGDLDGSTAYLLHRVIEALVQRSNLTTMALDLSGIRAIDTHGVRMLGMCRAHARAAGIRFTLANPSPVVRHAVDVCGQSDLLVGALITETPPVPLAARRTVCRRPPLVASRQSMRSR